MRDIICWYDKNLNNFVITIHQNILLEYFMTKKIKCAKLFIASLKVLPSFLSFLGI